MVKFSFLWSKLIRIARGKAVRCSEIDRTSRIHSGSTVVHTRVDRHSYCGYDCTLHYCDVGPFCSIASRVSVGGVAHPAHFVSTSPVFLSHKDSLKTKFAKFNYLPLLRTTIGADVWIGEGALIKAGVRIGHGAIIGMGAVVTSDVAPYAIVGGSPARVIRFRFDPHVIEKLLEVEWWSFSDERLHELGPVMNDPKSLLESVEML